MYSLRTVWEASSEAERDYPLMINAFLNDKEPVRSQFVQNDYCDGKKMHPSVLILSDLAPEEVE